MFCQLCGKEPAWDEANNRGEPMTRLPYISRQGDMKALEAPADGMARGVGQKWEFLHFCKPCTEKLIQNLQKAIA